MSIVISRTPFRISFFGGGTDYPLWYKQNGGAVLSTSIDKYCYISCRYLPKFFPDTYRIVWSHIEVVSSVGEILHPAVREGLRMLNFEGRRGVEIHHQGDLPARAGMGSSSSFANGLINALSAMDGVSLSKKELFENAIKLEQDVLRENVGSQDQVATAVGGINVITFHQSGEIVVEPLNIKAARIAEFESHLMLFYLGSSRIASEVAAKVIENIPSRSAEIERLHSLVFEGRDIIEGTGPISDLGALLDETWEWKRRLSSVVSNPVVDATYQKATSAGALGGKLLGAGVSGFMLFFVPPDRQNDVKMALSGLMHVPFRFDFEGSVIITNNNGLASVG